MFARLRPLAFMAVGVPVSARAPVTAPGNPALCADRAITVAITPKGCELATVTRRMRKDGAVRPFEI